MRSHQNVDPSPDTLATQRQLLRLQISNEMFHDEAIVFFDPNASDDFDPYDSPKLSNDVDSVPEIYTLAGDEQMVINGLNNAEMNKGFALGFKTGKSGTFILKATEISHLNDVSILLMDKQLNTVTDLTSGNTYTFKSDSTNTTDRFSVATAKEVTGLNLNENRCVSVYSSMAGKIAISVHGNADEDCRVSVYSILGQRLLDASISGEKMVLDKDFASGVYLVVVNGGGGKVVKRVEVK